jgi:hypothetical protein
VLIPETLVDVEEFGKDAEGTDWFCLEACTIQ